jgi:hypothetical protein
MGWVENKSVNWLTDRWLIDSQFTLTLIKYLQGLTRACASGPHCKVSGRDFTIGACRTALGVGWWLRFRGEDDDAGGESGFERIHG